MARLSLYALTGSGPITQHQRYGSTVDVPISILVEMIEWKAGRVRARRHELERYVKAADQNSEEYQELLEGLNADLHLESLGLKDLATGFDSDLFDNYTAATLRGIRDEAGGWDYEGPRDFWASPEESKLLPW